MKINQSFSHLEDFMEDSQILENPTSFCASHVGITESCLANNLG